MIRAFKAMKCRIVVLLKDYIFSFKQNIQQQAFSFNASAMWLESALLLKVAHSRISVTAILGVFLQTHMMAPPFRSASFFQKACFFLKRYYF